MAYLQSRRGKSVVFDRVEITEDTTARDCPSLRKECDHATVEIFVQMEGALVVVKGIGEQRECELDRAVTPVRGPAANVCEDRSGDRADACLRPLGRSLDHPAPPNRSAQPKQCSYSVAKPALDQGLSRLPPTRLFGRTIQRHYVALARVARAAYM